MAPAFFFIFSKIGFKAFYTAGLKSSYTDLKAPYPVTLIISVAKASAKFLIEGALSFKQDKKGFTSSLQSHYLILSLRLVIQVRPSFLNSGFS